MNNNHHAWRELGDKATARSGPWKRQLWDFSGLRDRSNNGPVGSRDSATKRIIETPELLLCIAEQIRSRHLLYDLCLVSCQFRDIFTRYLYREIRLDHEFNKINSLLQNPSLKYARLLSIRPPRGLPDTPEQDFIINELVQKLISRMPLLSTLRCLEWPVSSLTLSFAKKKCPRLTELSITFERDLGSKKSRLDMEESTNGTGHWETIVDDGDDWSAELDGRSDDNTLRYKPFSVPLIPVFTNLTVLRLHQLYGNMDHWQSLLVKLFKACQNLDFLSLSIDEHTVRLLHNTGRQDTYVYFLENLCKRYEASGGRPLQLQTLLLGWGVFPWGDRDERREEARRLTTNPALLRLYNDPNFTEWPALYLSKLTRLDTIKHFHVTNRKADLSSNPRVAIYEDELHTGLGWATCTPDFMPNLTRLGTSSFSDDLESVLWTLQPEFSRQLTLPYLYGMSSFKWDDQDYQKKPLPFRQLELELDYEMQYTNRTAAEILFQLVHTHAGCLDSMHLVLATDGEIINTVEVALRHLPKLAQLSVDKRIPYTPGVPQEPHLEGFAVRMAKAVTSIRYIKVCWLAWSVNRGPDNEVARMDLLDDVEQEGVELFRWRTKSYPMGPLHIDETLHPVINPTL